MKLSKFSLSGKNKLVPLVFHKIVSNEPRHWEDVKETTFKKIIEYVVIKSSVSDSNIIDKKSKCLITFDDGNISDYDIVFPILMEKGVEAIFFVVVDQIGKPGYMNWNHILEMKKNGMEIGSHSMSHPTMSSLSITKANSELRKSKLILEDFLGSSVRSFSYPYGDYNNKTNNLALSAGYSFLYTSKHGVLNSGKKIIPRNSINSSMSLKQIINILEVSTGTVLRWWIEDNTKPIVKAFLGPSNYKKIRNFFLK